MDGEQIFQQMVLWKLVVYMKKHEVGLLSYTTYSKKLNKELMQ